MSTVIANTCIHYDLMYVLHSLELCGRVGISDLDKATDNIPSICFNRSVHFSAKPKVATNCCNFKFIIFIERVKMNV